MSTTGPRQRCILVPLGLDDADEPLLEATVAQARGLNARVLLMHVLRNRTLSSKRLLRR